MLARVIVGGRKQRGGGVLSLGVLRAVCSEALLFKHQVYQHFHRGLPAADPAAQAQPAAEVP